MPGKNCPKCGVMQLSNARVCYKCGASLEDEPPAVKPVTATTGFCPECGSPLVTGDAFCSNCGAAIGRSAAPKEVYEAPARPVSRGEPERSATAKKANKEPSEKPKSKRAFAAVLSVVLVAAIGAGAYSLSKSGFFKKDKTDKSGKDSGSEGAKVTAVETGTVSAGANAITLCGVTLDVDPMMLDSGDRNVSVSVCEGGTNTDGSRYDAYELEMGEHEDFSVPVEVTFPCQTAADTDVIVEHFDDGVWKPLISCVDEDAGTVTAYFGSFSPVRVSYYPVGVNPSLYRVVVDDKPYMATIELRSNYWNILQRINPKEYSDEVTAFIDDPTNYAVAAPKLDPSMNAQAAYQAFTETNTMWGFCDPMINMGIETLPYSSQSKVVSFMIDHSGDLSSAMNVIPFVAMATQMGFDLSSGKKDSSDNAGTNLYKNLLSGSGTIYSLSTGYGHLGFSLAFVGVSVFGMELDFFVDAAKSAQAENVSEVFNAYYTDIEPFDDDHWYTVFEDAYWHSNGDANAAMRDVKTAVDEYCEKFWKDVYDEDNSDLLFSATSAKYRNVFMKATSDQKAALTEQQKAKVWELIETKSMKKIQRFLIERLQEHSREQLSKVTELYNKVLTVRIQETIDQQSTDIAKYKGCTLCLATDGVPVPELHWNIPDTEAYDVGWDMDFDCTVLGYLKLGMPDQVLVYKTESDYKSGAEPLTTRDFSINMEGDCTAIVELTSGSTPDWVNGAWSYAHYDGGSFSGFHRESVRLTIIDDHTLLYEEYFYPDTVNNYTDWATGLDYSFEREYTYDPDTETLYVPKTVTGVFYGNVFKYGEQEDLVPFKMQRIPEKDYLTGHEAAQVTLNPKELTGEDNEYECNLRFKCRDDDTHYS